MLNSRDLGDFDKSVGFDRHGESAEFGNSVDLDILIDLLNLVDLMDLANLGILIILVKLGILVDMVGLESLVYPVNLVIHLIHKIYQNHQY